MTRAQSRALETLFERQRIPLSADVADWCAWFGREAPLAVEIGFGMGHALLDMARQHPEWNCIGIEVYRPGIGALLNAACAAEIRNVRIIEGDARDVLANMVAEGTLQRIALYFPDPWPKSKHHKRRLVDAEFAAVTASRLAPDGELHVATDWKDYADTMLEVLDAQPRLANRAGHGQFAVRSEERPTTRFEARGQRLGHDVWELVHRRVPDPKGTR